jgi:hypothetical protein
MNTLMWTEVAFSALLLCFAILSEMVSHQAILKRQMVYADPTTEPWPMRSGNRTGR